MRRKSSDLTVLTLAVVFATASLGTSSCDEKKVRKELWKYKNKTGKALVATDEAWNLWFQAEADIIGDAVIADNPGLSDDEYLALFEAKLGPLNTHDEKLKIGAEALEAFEESLDAWEHITADDKGPARKAVLAGKDLINALGDITEIVIAAGVPYEGAFTTIDTIVQGLGKILDTIADEPDPDSE